MNVITPSSIYFNYGDGRWIILKDEITLDKTGKKTLIVWMQLT